MIRRISFFALCLTFIVVVFGAYVRLSDAGLGCPDWPGCYGKPTPLHARQDIDAAHAANPGGGVSMPKAWKEMIHRYIAASLGMLVIVVAILSIRRYRKEGGEWPWLASTLLGVVILQGLLGRWTVTLLLKPVIVSLHLVGGLTLLALLKWLWLRERGAEPLARPPLAYFARLCLVVLAAQIVLGGWVSTNYAALACPDLPVCQGQWVPAMNFSDAFHVRRELGMTNDGQVLPMTALTAIHWTHRVGAVVTGCLLLMLALHLLAVREARHLGMLLIAGLLLQLSLGMANVALRLPLPVAIAHNAGAALLLLIMIRIAYCIRPAPRQIGMKRWI